MLKGKNSIKWGGEFRRYLVASFAGEYRHADLYTTSTTPTSLFQIR